MRNLFLPNIYFISFFEALAFLLFFKPSWSLFIFHFKLFIRQKKKTTFEFHNSCLLKKICLRNTDDWHQLFVLVLPCFSLSLIFNRLINYGNWILNERIQRKYLQKKRITRYTWGFFWLNFALQIGDYEKWLKSEKGKCVRM